MHVQLEFLYIMSKVKGVGFYINPLYNPGINTMHSLTASPSRLGTAFKIIIYYCSL